jgi:hypothetical protein
MNAVTKVKQPIDLSKKQLETMSKMNTSQKIRFLDKEGLARADIARTLGKRYQHVRNVLTQPIKVAQ